MSHAESEVEASEACRKSFLTARQIRIFQPKKLGQSESETIAEDITVPVPLVSRYAGDIDIIDGQVTVDLHQTGNKDGPSLRQLIGVVMVIGLGDLFNSNVDFLRNFIKKKGDLTV